MLAESTTAACAGGFSLTVRASKLGYAAANNAAMLLSLGRGSGVGCARECEWVRESVGV